MNTTRKRAFLATFAALIAATTLATTSAIANPPALTLEHLKNGSYEIPNSACGSTVVQLHNGKGSAEDLNVIFGRAAFGKLHGEPAAVVHLAYKDDMLGWQQGLAFVVEHKGKVLQLGTLGMDEREQLKNIEVRDGYALVETTAPEAGSDKLVQKCIKAELVDRKEGVIATETKYAWLTTEKDSDSAPRLVSLR